jgi:acetylornithine deacetylase/succinyl-diaminopimelate desuccinylase-like protein
MILVPSTTRLLIPWVVLAVAGCGAVHRPAVIELPPARTEWHTAVDWDSAGEEATRVLAGYLQTDTRNPPGGETLGATYLARILEAEGIESEIFEFEPGRGSLVARLRGTGQDPPLCLLSHIDVVPWEADGWDEGKGPLSGVVDEEGILWGRGALDMKGMGAVELMTMIWLKRLAVPLSRDVVLLAVADEEVASGGSRMLLERWDEIGCSHMVNEGGIGVRGIFFDDQTVYAISVAEKGVLWLRMTATGEPGHGSTPRPDEAPTRLLDALAILRESWRPEPVFHPALYDLFYRIGESRKGVERDVMIHPGAVRTLLKGFLMANPVTAAMITNTVHITGLEGANKPNVVPGATSALLDCRIQPETDPMDVLEEIKAIFTDHPWISFEVISSFPGASSPPDDPFFGVLSRAMTMGQEDAVAGPIVSVGYTDSNIFRAKGVRAYGIEPFAIGPDDLATMHGHRERISVANVRDGLRRFFIAVVDFAAADGGEPPPAPVRAGSGLPTEPVRPE